MTYEVKETFMESVDAYLQSATYLTDEDAPMVTALVLTARELDANGISTRLLSDFGIAYRTLSKKAPVNTLGDTAQDEFLDAL